MSKFLIARGIGFSPGSVKYITTLGFEIGAAAPALVSSDNVFVVAGFIEDGFFELAAPAIIQPPAIINLGSPGDAVHALPFRALGGSIADLDLLYGVLGHEANLEDIQPIFALGMRAGEIRAFGYERPRQAILDIVLEAYPTLLEIEDIVIEGNPAGANLFGFVGLTTRPMSSVRISNADGYWSLLVVRELILNAPAGLFVDVSHSVVMPLLVGTVSGYAFDGPDIVIRYGFQARPKSGPNVLD